MWVCEYHSNVKSNNCILVLFQSRLAMETKTLLTCMGKQPKVEGLPHTSLIVLVGLFMNDDIDDQEEKLEPRGDAIELDSESELQSNMSKPITSSSSWKQSWDEEDDFLLFPRFTLFFQNLSLDLVEGLVSGIHGLGSPRLRSAGGGLSGGRTSLGCCPFAIPGCISHLNGTPSLLL